MGIQLAKTVVTRLGSLSGPAYKVLMFMAVTALDKPNSKGQPAGLYFGGRGALAVALGYPVDVDAAGRELVPIAATSAIKRALKELRDRGLITDMEQAKTGTNQSYRLNLSAADLAHWGSLTGPQSARHSAGDRGSPSGPHRGSLSGPHRGVRSGPTGGRSATPQGEDKDPHQDLSQDCIARRGAQPPGHAQPRTAPEQPTQHADRPPAPVPARCPSCTARMPSDGECMACGWRHPEAVTA